jgi:hypothetical protein
VPGPWVENKTSVLRRHGVHRPKRLEAGPFAADVASFGLHLAAENKAAGTVRTYAEAALWFAAAHLLRETGKTRWGQVDARDVQRWTVRLLATYSDAYARNQAEGPYETTHFKAHFLLAMGLIDVGRAGEATPIVDFAESVGVSAMSPWPDGIGEALRARIALVAGRLDDAAAHAQAASRAAGTNGAAGHDTLALPVLATVALRRGNLRVADGYAGRLADDCRFYGSAYRTGTARLVAAQVLEARRGPRAALDYLTDVLGELGEHRSVLLADPGNGPWLVRAALATGDRAQAAGSVPSSVKRPRPTPRSPPCGPRPPTPKDW